MKYNNNDPDKPVGAGWEVTRRHFLKTSGLAVAGLSVSGSPLQAAASQGRPKLSFGIVTDAHYADKPSTGRCYRESLAKMTECVELMNEKEVDCLVLLGDLIDNEEGAEGEQAALKHLDAIEGVLKQFNGPRYHVLGNHDLHRLSKSQYMAKIENTGIEKEATFYSFDRKGVHFVVLDACFNQKMEPYDHGNFGWRDTHIPPEELKWLEKDLASTSKPVIVVVHQLLDHQGNTGVKNSPQVREVLQMHNVLAVFHGHHHRGQYTLIEGIHYYTLIAMVEGSGEENNSYAIVDVHEDNSLTVSGYRRAVSTILGA